jgi:hypothetical protein
LYEYCHGTAKNRASIPHGEFGLSHDRPAFAGANGGLTQSKLGSEQRERTEWWNDSYLAAALPRWEQEMRNLMHLTTFVLFSLAGPAVVHAQEAPASEDVEQRREEIISEAAEKVEEIARRVDESEKAKEVSAGILQPIYALAERFSFPAFYWVAFSLMTAGVVSFALQLVLAKIVVLSRLSLSLTEILSDALGLAISLVGLVLTTQAAAENSSFTASPAAVLSAALIGALAGFVFYWWGQKQEIQAVEGRRNEKT